MNVWSRGVPIAAVLGVILGAMAPAYAGNIIVDTDYVLKNKDKAGVVLIDARAEKNYKKGVIQGAAVIGTKGAAVELRDVDARILPVAKLEKILGDAGVTAGNEIIVYGDKGDTGPYVAFWILEYLGADKAKVYHGGIDDWTTAKHPITNEVKKLPAAKFTAKARVDRLATTDYVNKNLKNKEVQFVDVRTKKENSGDDIRALRGGYIPAATHTNIPYEEGWKDPEALKKLAEKKVDNRHGAALKDPAEIKALYKGLDPNKEVVAYCQTGTRSTQTYAVLRDMGFKKVRNYDDSWIVWGSNLDLPAANTSYFDFVKVNAAMKRIEDLEKKVEALGAKK
jgi:thiosulfate/3-mercaptopyruvate sulfurtransferase